MAKACIFYNIRSAMAMAAPPSTTSKTLYGIRAYLFSSSSVSNNHPKKDPNLIDDIKQGEGVFRFDPSDGEPEMTPTRKGGTSHKKHQWNAATDDGPNIKGNTGKSNGHKWNDDSTPGTNEDMGRSTVAKAGVGAVKAMETGMNMAKQTMDIVFDAAMETTHKIKEAVHDGGTSTGDGGYKREKKGYNGGTGNKREEKKGDAGKERGKKGYNVPGSDGRVDDLRKKDSGYDY